MKKMTVLRFISTLFLVATVGLIGEGAAGSGQMPSTTSSNEALLLAKQRSSEVREKLSRCTSIEDKVAVLEQAPNITKTIHSYPEVEQFFATASPKERYILLQAISLDQFENAFSGFENLPHKKDAIQKFVSTLQGIDDFYAPIGGLIGYHDTVLRLLTAQELPSSTEYVPPPLEDFREKRKEVWEACYEGTAQLGKTTQIFAIGGAGDRLHLLDEKTKEPLPAACLKFCGRSLFEGLMRDVEALEYWHYKAFDKQITIPVLMMTSMEKQNDEHIAAMGEKARWFGRKQDSIRRMVQPLVPLIDLEGRWVTSSPLDLVTKPGGHGVIWKLAQQSGSLSWLRDRGVETAIVRQINNPLAGLDNDLLTFIGYGRSHKKSFGFASVPSRPGFSEGMNVLSIEKEAQSSSAAISNIEYTQFATVKKQLPDLFKDNACPANTNILFADLSSIEKALVKDPIPGMIVNAKTPVETTKDGKVTSSMAARLESSMQNIADAMRAPIDVTKLPSVDGSTLPTFLVLQDRKKLFSVAKKAFQQGQNPYETPESCLYDWNEAMRQLLTQYCHGTIPKEQTLEEFLQHGPNFTFNFHPALGPLWEVIGQKVSNVTLREGSELELEVAEASCRNLTIDGSFRVLANAVTKKPGQLFSDKVGRIRLKDVTIVNEGIESQNAQDALQGSCRRKESCEIILEGFSEVSGENLLIKGNFRLVVPDGQKAILSSGPSGKVSVRFEQITIPTWTYSVSWHKQSAPRLQMQFLK
jgi:hypothetical protein